MFMVVTSVSPSPVVESFSQGFGLSLLILLGCVVVALILGALWTVLQP
jgi:hypothetical protein